MPRRRGRSRGSSRHWAARWRRCSRSTLPAGRSRRPQELAPQTAPGATHAFHLYVVRTAQPEALAAHLLAQGIQSARHYAAPIHRQPAYRDILRAKSLRNVERLYETMLSIPIYPELTDREVHRICEALSSWRAGGK